MPLRLSEVCTECPLDFPADDLSAVRVAANWIKTFLSEPHDHLGRPGDVCPYVRPAMARDSLWIAVERPSSPDEYRALLLKWKAIFDDIEPLAGPDSDYKCIIIALPAVEEESGRRLLNAIKDEMKSVFVKDGLMLGTFNPDRPRDHPDNWPPLSPVPLLAIRRMHQLDVNFLAHTPELRAAYENRFGGGLGWSAGGPPPSDNTADSDNDSTIKES